MKKTFKALMISHSEFIYDREATIGEVGISCLENDDCQLLDNFREMTPQELKDQVGSMNGSTHNIGVFERLQEALYKKSKVDSEFFVLVYGKDSDMFTLLAI